MKYIYIYGTKHDEYTVEGDNCEELIKQCKRDWAHLCDHDKKCGYAYVLKSINPDEDAEDHFDGDVVFDAKDGGNA